MRMLWRRVGCKRWIWRSSTQVKETRAEVDGLMHRKIEDYVHLETITTSYIIRLSPVTTTNGVSFHFADAFAQYWYPSSLQRAHLRLTYARTRRPPCATSPPHAVGDPNQACAQQSSSPTTSLLQTVLLWAFRRLDQRLLAILYSHLVQPDYVITH